MTKLAQDYLEKKHFSRLTGTPLPGSQYIKYKENYVLSYLTVKFGFHNKCE